MCYLTADLQIESFKVCSLCLWSQPLFTTAISDETPRERKKKVNIIAVSFSQLQRLVTEWGMSKKNLVSGKTITKFTTMSIEIYSIKRKQIPMFFDG